MKLCCNITPLANGMGSPCTKLALEDKLESVSLCTRLQPASFARRRDLIQVVYVHSLIILHEYLERRFNSEHI